MIQPSMAKGPPGCGMTRYAETELPTRWGTVHLLVYREVHDGEPDENKEHVALVFGDPDELGDSAHCRVHSECLTSEVFGSLKCDCREQLEFAIEHMNERQHGVILYLRQEGRGIGLGNKIRAYALQAQGADTVEANHRLGFDTDLRSYDIAAGMLHDLGLKSVELLTNNPEKIQGLEEYGIAVEGRVPVLIEPNTHSEGYLETKKEKCGHLLNALSSF